MLSKAEDKRSRFGLRHELTDVMLMCMMAIMSGYYGYREIGRFLNNHSNEFQQTFRLIHKVPSYLTIRSVLQSVDFESFCSSFKVWAGQYVQMGKDHTNIIVEKTIANTIVNYDNSYQNFISLVSVFSVQRGIVFRFDKIENNKESEIPTIRRLIEALDVNLEVFSIDVLYCQKKRLK